MKGGEAGINRLLSRLRHLFNWAIAEGYLLETPFKRGPVSVVRARTVENARTRRLEPQAKNGACWPMRPRTCAPCSWRRSQRAVGLANCCPCNGNRFGATRTASPAGSSCLGQDEDRRNACHPDRRRPASHAEPPATWARRPSPRRRRVRLRRRDGRAVRSIRTPWEDAVLLAHGFTPTRQRGKLTADARAHVRRIDLHIHDSGASLRAGCWSRRRACTTCRCSWDTRTSRRRAAICGARRRDWLRP